MAGLVVTLISHIYASLDKERVSRDASAGFRNHSAQSIDNLAVLHMVTNCINRTARLEKKNPIMYPYIRKPGSATRK